jgi:hypothetical protein
MINAILTNSTLTATLTSKPTAKVSAFRNACEAIKTICEITALKDSDDYRQTYQAVEDEHVLLTELKTRLVSLLQCKSLEMGSHRSIARMIYELEGQIKDTWRHLKINRHESKDPTASSRSRKIPMTYQDVLDKHAAAIEKHREIIRTNKNIIQTPIPDDYGYHCECEIAFAALYNYLPEADDPILCSEEFDQIADDIALIWSGTV